MSGVGQPFGFGGVSTLNNSGLSSNSINNFCISPSKIDSSNINVKLPSNGVSVDLAQTLEEIMKNYEILLKQYEYLYGYLQYKGLMEDDDYKKFCEAQAVAERLKESK
jgi:hypothetical protein